MTVLADPEELEVGDHALLVEDASHAQHFAELRALAHDRAPGAALALPLVAGDRCAAVLLIYAEAAADYTR